jgi:hypothetical protein
LPLNILQDIGSLILGSRSYASPLAVNENIAISEIKRKKM